MQLMGWLTPAAVLFTVAASMPSLQDQRRRRPKTLQDREWRPRSAYLHWLSSLRGHLLLVPRTGCDWQHFCAVTGRRIEDAQPRRVQQHRRQWSSGRLPHDECLRYAGGGDQSEQQEGSLRAGCPRSRARLPAAVRGSADEYLIINIESC